MGLPRKKNYSGRWDVLIDKSSKCLNRLLEIAARKKRNYIIDQVIICQTGDPYVLSFSGTCFMNEFFPAPPKKNLR